MLTCQCTSAGEGKCTPDDVSPTAVGLSREAGACFSPPSVAFSENHEQFCFHTSEKKVASLPGPGRAVISNCSFRRAFTVSKGLREQEVAHSVIHLDLELLDTDLNG